jgi:broad specificity phosphatase PhoE
MLVLRSIALAALVAGLAQGPVAAERAEPAHGALAAPRFADTTVTTVLLVRHAEKNTGLVGADPPLTAAGTLRAQELARVLGDAGLTAIYTTPYLRNRQTADPVARRVGLVPRVIHDTDSTVTAVRAEPAGSRVLVIGHSNTVPQIVARLTGDSIAIGEGEHDLLYVVTLPPRGRTSLMRLRYGAASAPRP